MEPCDHVFLCASFFLRRFKYLLLHKKRMVSVRLFGYRYIIWFVKLNKSTLQITRAYLWNSATYWTKALIFYIPVQHS